ncbi:MAG: HlyD family efflux transporter periplasmic adaptor subunit, partial [Planctomycetota bacterium]
ADDLPPQIQDPVAQFVDLTHAASVDAVPLLVSEQASSEPVGVLILERYRQTEERGFESRVTAIATLCARAVRNASDYEALPMLGLSKSVRDLLRMSPTRKRRWLGIVLLALSAAALLWLVPIRFTVPCEGEAVARKQRHLFAPLDGEIVELGCRHDEPVREGQVLLRLRNRQLELDLEQLTGEHQTVEKKLLAINLARLEEGREETSERHPGQLAAEEQELKQRLESIAAEKRILSQQLEKLTIRSPFAGQMMTWDPEGLLSDRPVQRGQRLLTVADLDGEWAIEVNIPIRSVGHVVESSQDSNAPLSVDFTVVNGIGRHFEGEITEIARRIDVTKDQQLAMRAWVAVEQDAVRSLRPGATVRARIDCGRRSAGYVWFHEVMNTIKQWVFL